LTAKEQNIYMQTGTSITTSNATASAINLELSGTTNGNTTRAAPLLGNPGIATVQLGNIISGIGGSH